jgi:hypothetical protein
MTGCASPRSASDPKMLLWTEPTFARSATISRTVQEARVFMYAMALCVALGLFAEGCSPDQVTVWSTEARSPDGQWFATGRSDQHTGMGNAAIVTGVYLRRADRSEPEQPILHFMDDYPPGKGGIEMAFAWLDSSHLQVTFTRPPKLNPAGSQICRHRDCRQRPSGYRERTVTASGDLAARGQALRTPSPRAHSASEKISEPLRPDTAGILIQRISGLTPRGPACRPRCCTAVFSRIQLDLLQSRQA